MQLSRKILSDVDHTPTDFTFNDEDSASPGLKLNMPKLNKYDNVTVINNLRKTIKDMTKRMKELEAKVESDSHEKSLHETRESNKLEFLREQLHVKDKHAKGLNIEIKQKINEANEVRSEYQG